MYLEDMLEFCDSVLVYTADQDAKSLGADAMRLDATLRKLSLIGEAATRVPEAIRELAAAGPSCRGPCQPSSRFWNTSPACSRSAWNLIFGQLASIARSSGAYSTSSVGALTAS